MGKYIDAIVADSSILHTVREAESEIEMLNAEISALKSDREKLLSFIEKLEVDLDDREEELVKERNSSLHFGRMFDSVSAELRARDSQLIDVMSTIKHLEGELNAEIEEHNRSTTLLAIATKTIEASQDAYRLLENGYKELAKNRDFWVDIATYDITKGK